MTTLKEASRDSSNDRDDFMTESNFEVVNFDMVKRQYLNELGFSEEDAKSVDAVFQSGDKYYLIEFKNGTIDSKNIKEKVKDTLLILGDIVGSTLSDSREKFEFILVYSEELHRNINYRNLIALHRAQQSKIDFDMFGLNHMQGYYFKNVDALLPQKLEMKLEKLM